ncbi:MAG: hypothetical protein F6K48_14300 [Okeania sp. SIO3H1]|uniref:hypothetical protein n=1 Tax=Okeania sp. SIO1I7 TaxID=2607772 RepID=UPI0013C85383|nr:hypothetical protein [Okeania sp. SIO1I7]NEN90017.1 hypothetical protein [Okeania sp. SIO3H1]NET24968.1 hypothetical protein [Okeania sp. SIO1I7]
MGKRLTIEVRIVGDKSDIEEFVASMHNWLKRDGYRLAKQPHFRKSRKEPTDTIAYTEWVKDCK